MSERRDGSKSVPGPATSEGHLDFCFILRIRSTDESLQMFYFNFKLDNSFLIGCTALLRVCAESFDGNAAFISSVARLRYSAAGSGVRDKR